MWVATRLVKESGRRRLKAPDRRDGRQYSDYALNFERALVHVYFQHSSRVVHAYSIHTHKQGDLKIWRRRQAQALPDAFSHSRSFP